MWGLHCIDLAAPQVSRDGVSQLLCSHSPSLVLEVPVGFLIWLAWVQLLPACLGPAHTRRGECVKEFCTCFHVLLKSDAKV